ncbi:MAG: HAD superfamily hydrolase (TIGR01484 family) [Flavobacteriales bacterium]|jgi:HAD superfamily hydrolase (TIGR01484 family)
MNSLAMHEKDNLLLCTDLDQTLIPNGNAVESKCARSLFRELVENIDITLIYVSGRNISQIYQAIDNYSLPIPAYIIADVGTSIYQSTTTGSTQLNSWTDKIKMDWYEKSPHDISQLIGNLECLKLQNLDQQGHFKLSYQVIPTDRMNSDLIQIKQQLKRHNIQYNCVISTDETIDQGFVDILPKSANKNLAIEYLINELKVGHDRVFCCGDSGNDLDMLSRGYPSALVKNSSDAVKQDAIRLCISNNTIESLYVAKGSIYKDMNGNYAAGIVEGFLHFFPEYGSSLQLDHN